MIIIKIINNWGIIMKYFIIALFMLLSSFKAHSDEVNCLALNIYHEARNQPLTGKLAVAFVTFNRVKSEKFPNTVCAVVKQGVNSKWWKEQHGKDVPLKNKCHFSWWCDGKSDEPIEQEVWELTKALAFHMYYRNYFSFDLTGGATHYHADYVTPYWAKKKERVIKIKNHIFYK
jgi:N-acetylmuramoyl-L-alanine amidase